MIRLFSTSEASSSIIGPTFLFSIAWNSTTGTSFEICRIFPRSFSHLLRIVPSDGFVLRNGDDPDLLALPEAPWTSMISVGHGESNDLRIADFKKMPEAAVSATAMEGGGRFKSVEWGMPGSLMPATLRWPSFTVLSQVQSLTSTIRSPRPLFLIFPPVKGETPAGNPGRQRILGCSFRFWTSPHRNRGDFGILAGPLAGASNRRLFRAAQQHRRDQRFSGPFCGCPVPSPTSPCSGPSIGLKKFPQTNGSTHEP